MEPYPIAFACASVASCLEEVPVEISEWKPEQAPQATVINRVGNSILPSASFQPLNAGSWKVAFPEKAVYTIPQMAISIIA